MTKGEIDRLVATKIDFGKRFELAESLDRLKALSSSEGGEEFYRTLYQAALINQRHRVHADKCGSFYADTRACSEDCAFCPLSRDHYNGLKTEHFQWSELPEAIYNFAAQMHAIGVGHFKVVTTGAKSDSRIVPYIAEGVGRAKHDFDRMVVCISEGILPREDLILLKNAGVDIFNNNLETSRHRFPQIVSTHTYDAKIEVIRLAKSLGYRICSGGLFGIGESLEERVELFLTLRELGVDSSPFNIFVRFPNLPLSRKLDEEGYRLEKAEVFYSIALFRLIMPETRLVLGGGRRDYFEEDEQRFALLIGASALASSGYLSKDGVQQSSALDDGIFLAGGLAV